MEAEVYAALVARAAALAAEADQLKPTGYCAVTLPAGVKVYRCSRHTHVGNGHTWIPVEVRR
jgi:hypothetical protein